jgi:hypothetical protein
MSLTRTQAVDEILALAKYAWETTASQTGTRFKYENVASASIPPSGQDAWGRIVLRHTTSKQTSLAGADGRRHFTRYGTLVVQIFEVVGTGIAKSTDIPEIMKNAYEGKSTAGGVIFRDVTINEVGKSGDYFQTNVVVHFEYTEIK